MSIGDSVNPLFQARQDGVRRATDASTEVKVPPQTVVGVAEAKVVFVHYCNARGEMETSMFFQVGDQLVAPKDTAEWCKRIYPMSDWMYKQVQAKQRAATAPSAPLPQGDSVDVLDGGLDENPPTA